MRKTACPVYVPYVQFLLQFQVSPKPIMSTKRCAATKAPAIGAKWQRKMLTFAEKVELLDMLKEGKSYAATSRHYGNNESSVPSIKKEENNIGTTAAISFNRDAKRVAIVRHRTMVRMESASALCINDCRKNITPDTSVICTKTRTLYQTFADSGSDREEGEDSDTGPSSSAVHTVPSEFNASKGWLENFKKCFGHKNVSLHREIASADTAKAEVFMSIKFIAIIEEGGYKPEQVFNMDRTALFWKRRPSRTFVEKEEARAPGFKAQNDRLTLVVGGNAASFMIKPGFIYRSKIKTPEHWRQKTKMLCPFTGCKCWDDQSAQSGLVQKLFHPGGQVLFERKRTRL